MTALVETVQGVSRSRSKASPSDSERRRRSTTSPWRSSRARIHALVGENGAGKSTLGKIIGGVYVADTGVLRVDGADVGRWNPPAALAAGIATIQQELSLVPARSVAENVFLGIERARFGVLLGSVLERYRELDERVGFGLPGDVPVSSLRLADQQKVEIMRALARDARLIVLDEPTSSLSRDESDRLHTLMRVAHAPTAARSSTSATSSTRCSTSPTR